MNAYEIRTEILKLAYDQVHNEYQHKLEQQMLITPEDEELDEDNLPEAPTVEDVLRVAEKMYQFVSDNTGNR